MKWHNLLNIALLATMLTCANSDAPRMAVSSRMSLGEVGAGQSIEFALPVRNEGKAPLRVADISGSCGCIVPLQTRGEIAPHAERNFPLALSTKDQKPGTHRQRITLHGNDPACLSTTVELLYFVRPGLTLEPEAIRVFQPVTLPAKYEVRLVAPAEGQYELIHVTADVPLVEVHTPSLPAACRKEGLLMSIGLKPVKNWVGPVDARVSFTLNNLSNHTTETMVLPLYFLRIS
ncbi:MAG: DUF1573 domain-containing protein [FCB group bacterium]|nr:DUF1573 domain-containing protein [FCB group bacterium]